MKKLLYLLPLTLLALGGCNNSAFSYKLDLKVLSPTGAPAIGMYALASEENYTTTTNPKEGLIPQFQTNNYDVIIAPTNGGLMQIVKQSAAYKIAATITYGNFHIVSMGTDDDNTLNAGDKVVFFQTEDIPGKVFNYLYGDLDLVTYDAGTAEGTKRIITDRGIVDGVQYDYVFTAEPVISATSSTIFINVAEAFKEKSGGKLLTQASVFVRNDVSKEKADKFLNALEKDINDGLKNPDLIKEGIEKLGSTQEQQNKIGVPGAVAKKASVNNGFGLGFNRAINIKADIENFMSLIAPALSNLDEEVFYK